MIVLGGGKSIFIPIALRKAKIVCNFGLSECNRVKTNTVILLESQQEQFNVF